MVIQKYNPVKHNVKKFSINQSALAGPGSGAQATEERTSPPSWPSCLCFVPESAPNAHLLLLPWMLDKQER